MTFSTHTAWWKGGSVISEARSLGSSLGTLILEGMGCRHPTALRPTCRKATCCPRVSGPAGLLLTALADSRVRKPARTSRPGEPPCICSPANMWRWSPERPQARTARLCPLRVLTHKVVSKIEGLLWDKSAYEIISLEWLLGFYQWRINWIFLGQLSYLISAPFL